MPVVLINMKTIYAFTLHTNVVHMPVGAVIKHVSSENGKVVLRAEAQANEAPECETRTFVVLDDGEPVANDTHVYVGTAMIEICGRTHAHNVFEVVAAP